MKNKMQGFVVKVSEISRLVEPRFKFGLLLLISCVALDKLSEIPFPNS